MSAVRTSTTSRGAAVRIREPFPLTPIAGLLAVVLTGALWGTIGVVTGQLKAAFPNPSGSGSALSSLVLVAIRLGITAPTAALVARLVLGSGAFRLPRRAIVLGLGLGLVQAFFQYAYVEAVTNAGVGIATAIELCLAPVLVAALSVVALRERPDRTILLAILVAAAGTIVLAANGSSPKFAATFGGVDIVGVARALAEVGRRLAERSLSLEVTPEAVDLHGMEKSRDRARRIERYGKSSRKIGFGVGEFLVGDSLGAQTRHLAAHDPDRIGDLFVGAGGRDRQQGRLAPGTQRTGDAVGEPSPLAHEIVTGKPYTYLDNAPAGFRGVLPSSLRVRRT